MKKEKNVFDVAVIGAGPAGAAAAYFLSENGLRTALFESRNLSEADPNWVNGILPEAFDRVGIERPEGKELDLKGFPIVMAGKNAKCRAELNGKVLWNIHMPHLNARLHRMAKDTGTHIFDNVKSDKFIFDNGRPVELKVTPGQKSMFKDKSVFAKLFVDATGLDGVLREQVPALENYCKPVSSENICFAMQKDFKIKNIKVAQEFLDIRNIMAGTMYNLLGTAGGYSTMTIHIYPDMKTVGLLAGSIDEKQYKKAPKMINNVKEDNKWIGEEIHGGGRTDSSKTPLRQDCRSRYCISWKFRLSGLPHAWKWCRKWSLCGLTSV
jgi:flavin-dependent dehydrogenase